jgi:hypothetical protein
MSDLNARIKTWRDALAPAVSAADLDELEDHLRQAVAALPGDALTFDERFLVATHRLGTPQTLIAEFAKAQRASRWRDRVVWMMVLGIVCVGIGSWVASATLYNLDERFANHLDEWLPRPVMIRSCFVLLMTGLGSWTLWHSSLSTAGKVGSTEAQCK